MDLTAVGIGLGYSDLRLATTTTDWIDAGSKLRDRIAFVLDDVAVDVAHIGSSAVLGLEAKPIIDLAVAIAADHPIEAAVTRLESEGWIYRGDAGDDGGHVFVLETRPWFRVAHIHVGEYSGREWNDYLRLRDILQSSRTARDLYAAAKRDLIARGLDRTAYTNGKTDVVRVLLSG